MGLWQHFYNWHRPHTALNGITPFERFFALIEDTPWSWEVQERYDPDQEPFREANYQVDKQMLALHKKRQDAIDKASGH